MTKRAWGFSQYTQASSFQAVSSAGLWPSMIREGEFEYSPVPLIDCGTIRADSPAIALSAAGPAATNTNPRTPSTRLHIAVLLLYKVL